MKRIITTVTLAALLAFGLTTINLKAATSMPNALPFLTSKAALKTFATESARNASLQLASPGMADPSWGIGTGWSSPKREVDVLSQFNSLKIAVPMVNVEDYIHATATIADQMGNVLFTADSWSTPVMGPGGYELPQMWFGFVLAKTTHFRVNHNIRMGFFRYLDANGHTIGDPIPVSVSNGDVDFNGDFAGKGILELWDQDSTRFEYDLRNGGQQIQIQQVSYNGSASFIDGMYGFTDPNRIDWEVWSYNGIGQNPAFEITVVNEKGSLPIRVYSNEGAVAVGYNVRVMGTTNWMTYPVVVPGQYGQILLDNAGVLYIVPVWNQDEFRDPDPDPSELNPPVTSPSSGGGSGGGEKG